MRSLNRYAEVDVLRTAAILLMIAYHVAFDLSWFYDWNIDPFSGGWKLLARITATLFLVLVGVSAALLRKGMLARKVDEYAVLQRFLRRGLWVLSCGMLVSLATVIVDPSTFVRFGILHLIGTSLLLLPFCLRLGGWNLLLATPFFATYAWTSTPHDVSSIWLPIGLFRADFATVDYFPLLPWFGAVLVGAALGHLLYVRPTPLSRPESPLRRFFDGLQLMRVGKLLALPGRHSLLLYMVHQPVILALLYIVLGRPSL